MWVTWREAIQQALYGETGFYLRERPSGHFRTSVGVSPVFAEVVLRLLEDVDARLGHPDRLDLVDLGAGDGMLTTGILSLASPELAARLRITAVEVAPRPLGLAREIAWVHTVPALVNGMVIANEWLDNVPFDLAEQTEQGPRLVLVDPRTGLERLGPEPCEDDLAWLHRWWSLKSPGDRAEIGRPRDEAWAKVIGQMYQGVAIAVDYAHPVDNRPQRGTLMAYRDGGSVTPVPDGSCDITAHVALDACAEAGRGAGATATTLTTQREAMLTLGITGTRPSLHLAHADPRAYLRELARSSEEAELIDPSGLGAFGWLTQWVNVPQLDSPRDRAGDSARRVKPAPEAPPGPG